MNRPFRQPAAPPRPSAAVAASQMGHPQLHNSPQSLELLRVEQLEEQSVQRLFDLKCDHIVHRIVDAATFGLRRLQRGSEQAEPMIGFFALKRHVPGFAQTIDFVVAAKCPNALARGIVSRIADGMLITGMARNGPTHVSRGWAGLVNNNAFGVLAASRAVSGQAQVAARKMAQHESSASGGAIAQADDFVVPIQLVARLVVNSLASRIL